MGQRVMRHQVGQMKTFRSFRAEKLSARRNIEKKIAHDDGGAARVGRVFYITHPSALNHDARCRRCFLCFSD